jgi:hypothetical protein
MRPLGNDEQRRLLQEISAAVAKVDPQWTGGSQSDPGAALLELFSWLAENVDYRLTAASAEDPDKLRRVLTRLQALWGSECSGTGQLERVNYFQGQYLSASDFQAEQDYHREKRRLHNRFVLGTGVVSGLEISLDPASAGSNRPTITVSPGFAVDARGEELVVCEPMHCSLQGTHSSGYVILRYCEKPLAAAPSITGSEGSAEPTRIKEGVAVEFARKADGNGVALAYLESGGGKWWIDTKFRTLRIKK